MFQSLKLRGRSLTCESILALAQMRHLTSLCLAESAPHYLNYVADTAATTLLTSSLAFLPGADRSLSLSDLPL